jgi:hypothetical protein
MANIKLSEIPNAPQGVANYTMNPQYTGDVVGGEAKAAINKGYEGLMVNPQSAGAIGRAQAGFGSDMISAAGNVASGALYVAKGEKTAQLKDAEVTGMQNFYINKLNIESEFNERVNNPDNHISVAQRSAEWLKITDGGKRFMAGMTPMQQQAYMGEATNAFTKGLASTANEAHAFQQQEFASAQTAIIDNLTQDKKYKDARKVRNNAVQTGAITPQDGQRYESMFKIGEQKDGLLAEFANDSKGELYKNVKAAGDAGEVLKKYPDLSPENLVKMAKIGESIHYQNIWAKNVDPMLDKIQANHIIDPKQLEQYPEFQAAPEEQKQMLRMRAAYTRTGNEAVVYDKAGQNLVDTFPKDLDNASKELLDRKTWITGNVSDATAPVLIKELDNKFAEMVGNNGRLKPETSVMTNAAQQVDAIFDTGFYGGNKFSEIAKTIRDGTASAADTNTYLQISALKDSVMQKVRASGAQTDAAAQKVYEQELRNIRATDPNPPTEGSLWWKKTIPIPSAKMSENNSNPVGRVTSYGYKGDSTPDTNSSNGIGAFTKKLIAGQSFGTSYDIEAKLRAAGIKPNDKVELTLANGEKVVKIWHDRGATDDQARKLGIKPLRGRFDFYSPSGPDKRSDLAVLSFRKADKA